jgi:O-antigen/teichoic acid export membrane protein
MLWRILPTGSRPRFEKTILTTIWRFAAGMAGISILSLLLMELDKIILSTFLPLVSFGYYNLAAVVASGISVLTAPLFTAVFPRLTQLVAHNDQQRLIELYHTSCQLLAVCVLSTGVTLATFAPEVLLIWTGDTTIVQHTWPLVSLLVIGTTLNGLMNIPYALQLAYGWTRLALYQNIIAVVLLVPLLIWITNRYGAVGAACIWPLLNAGYVLFGIQAMHTRLLPSEKIRWYTHDVGLPLLGALLGASLGLLVIPVNASRPLLAIYIGAVLVASLISAFAFTAFSGNRMWWRILSFVRRG